MLRPALEAAVDVARAGRRETPPVTPPRPLVPLLRFAKLPDRALATIADVLDRDSELRARVVAAIEEAGTDVGAPGRLFLARPPGWEQELASHVEAWVEMTAREQAAIAERAETRRVTALQEEARTLAAALARARTQIDELTSALAAERAAVADARAALAAAQARIAQLERERDAAHRKAATAERDRAEAAAELAAERGNQDDAAAAAVRRHLDAQADDLRRTLGAAAELAAHLTSALAEAVAAVEDVAPDDSPAGAPLDSTGEDRGRPRRRQPEPVPPGLGDDTTAAAEHLVRLPGCVLLVDGYNASLRAWDDRPLTEQRDRLVHAADELAARTGAEIVIVFDGVDAAPTVASRATRRRVTVRFTASHVEADDAILASIDAVPIAKPVVVASDDHRVREGAAQRGANVLTQRQLFGLLRRAIA